MLFQRLPNVESDSIIVQWDQCPQSLPSPKINFPAIRLDFHQHTTEFAQTYMEGCRVVDTCMSKTWVVTLHFWTKFMSSNKGRWLHRAYGLGEPTVWKVTSTEREELTVCFVRYTHYQVSVMIQAKHDIERNSTGGERKLQSCLSIFCILAHPRCN